LLAGENHYLYCLYKPLIAKTYNFTVLVHVFDFNKKIQTLELQIEGKGYVEAKSVQSLYHKPIPGQRTTVS